MGDLVRAAAAAISTGESGTGRVTSFVSATAGVYNVAIAGSTESIILPLFRRSRSLTPDQFSVITEGATASSTQSVCQTEDEQLREESRNRSATAPRSRTDRGRLPAEKPYRQ